jgi:hypothetical protein
MRGSAIESETVSSVETKGKPSVYDKVFEVHLVHFPERGGKKVQQVIRLKNFDTYYYPFDQGSML